MLCGAARTKTRRGDPQLPAVPRHGKEEVGGSGEDNAGEVGGPIMMCPGCQGNRELQKMSWGETRRAPRLQSQLYGPPYTFARAAIAKGHTGLA